MRLTKRSVEGIVPPAPGERVTKIWDDELKGFGVLVLPSGTRSYIVQYRNSDGRSRRQTLGRHGVITLDQARQMARAALVEVAKGSDPLAERQARRDAPDVSALLDRYLAEHVDVHNAKTFQKEIHRLVEKHLRPAMGRLKVQAVGSAELARLHASMRSAPRVANLTLAVASKAFSLAEVWELRPRYSNPARGIRKFAENKRKTSLSDDQLAALGRVLHEAETIGLPWEVAAAPSKHLPADRAAWRTTPNATALVALRLILLTGARLSEILELRWEHVDLDRRTLALPAHKGAARHPHPVGEVALQLVRTQKAEAKRKSPWVLPRDADPARHVSKEVVENLWGRLRRRAGISDIRIHDLRHAFGTIAGADGANAFLVRDVMRHENLSMTSRYVAANDDPVRSAMGAVEQKIVQALSSTGTSE
jgi:integrase